jgi:hypothetical protein
VADQHGFLYDWQTLIAGVLAVGAAVLTVLGTETYSRRRDLREIEAIKASLGVEIKAILNVLLQAHYMLVNTARLAHIKPSSIKSATELPNPVVYRATADRIGLWGEAAPLVTSFYIALDRINVGVKVVVTDANPHATVDFGELRVIARLFEQACQTSLPLLSHLPPNEGDAELRPEIEAMKPFAWQSPLPP